jgi:hypothetical protein
VIDTSRRSYTYETRLLKYAKRGFAVFDERLERDRVTPDLANKRFHQVTGLARLLLLEQLYVDQRQKEAARRPQQPRHRYGRYYGGISLEDLKEELRGDASLREQVSDFEMAQPKRLRVEDYNSVFLPWGPAWTGALLANQLKAKYIGLNGGCRRDDLHKIVPAFFYFDLENVLSGVWTARFRAGWRAKAGPVGDRVVQEPLREDYEDRYLVGPLQWLSVNPGRQMIGSFHPHERDDWTVDAYADADIPRASKKRPREDASLKAPPRKVLATKAARKIQVEALPRKVLAVKAARFKSAPATGGVRRPISAHNPFLGVTNSDDEPDEPDSDIEIVLPFLPKPLG